MDCTYCENHNGKKSNCAHSLFMSLLDNGKESEIDLQNAITNCGNHNDILYKACHNKLKKF